jgi:hypothetical protein
MRVTHFATWILLSGLFCTVAPLGAQSLGDVAKKEEDRRKAVASAGKVYTNKDLPSVPAPAPGASPAAAPPAAKGGADASADNKDKDDKQTDAQSDATRDKPAPKDQAYWAERSKKLHDQLERDQTFSEALQSRINALTTDFVNRSDPAQRAVIERDRQKALAELSNLKKQIDDNRKALADLEEEARRAAVPPGWLR